MRWLNLALALAAFGGPGPAFSGGPRARKAFRDTVEVERKRGALFDPEARRKAVERVESERREVARRIEAAASKRARKGARYRATLPPVGARFLTVGQGGVQGASFAYLEWDEPPASEEARREVLRGT